MEKEESLGFYIGLDLAQANDYTAVIVLDHIRIWDVPEHVVARDPSQAPPLSEAPKVPSGPLRDEYRVRHIRRCNGKSYVEIVALIGKLLARIPPRNVHLIVDETGVGKPIIDMFRAADLNPVPVTVHGGTNTTHDQGSWHVPKRDIVAAAKRLLAQGQLKIIEDPLTDTLVNELQDFHVKININTGHDSYEAWREGTHDDLVFALALACWYCLKKQNRGGRVIMGVEVEKGGEHTDQSRVSMMRDAEKGGRWQMTGFREGGFNPP